MSNKKLKTQITNTKYFDNAQKPNTNAKCMLLLSQKHFRLLYYYIKEFDWQSLNSVCDVLEPLIDCILELQKSNAGIHFNFFILTSH